VFADDTLPAAPAPCPGTAPVGSCTCLCPVENCARAERAARFMASLLELDLVSRGSAAMVPASTPSQDSGTEACTTALASAGTHSTRGCRLSRGPCSRSRWERGSGREETQATAKR